MDRLFIVPEALKSQKKKLSITPQFFVSCILGPVSSRVISYISLLTGFYERSFFFKLFFKKKQNYIDHDFMYKNGKGERGNIQGDKYGT